MSESQSSSSMEEPTAKKLKLIPKSFANLSPYLIEKILSHCFIDRHSLKTVCKAFYEAIWKIHGDNYTLSLDVNDEETLSDIVSHSVLDHQPIRFSNLRLHINNHKKNIGQKCEMKDIFVKFLEAKGQYVRSLKIDDLNDKLDKIQPIFKYMQNVTRLLVDVPFIPIDESLKDSLDLSELSNLKEIRVWCKDEFEILKRIKLPEGTVRNVEISIGNPSLEYALCPFLEPARESIRNLSLHVQSYQSLQRMKACGRINYENLKLENLHLKCAGDEVICKFVTTQVNLKVLKLSRTKTSDEILELIISKLHQLEHISVNLSSIRPENFDKLRQLRSLKVLQLGDADLEQLLVSDTQLEIPELYLKNCTISIVGARYLIGKFPKLTNLSIDFRHELQSNVIQEILEHGKQLEKIEIVGNQRWDHNCLTLQSLNVTNQELKNLIIKCPIALDLNFLRSFQNITEINLYVRNKRSDSFETEIEGIFREFPNLKKILLMFYVVCRIVVDILPLINGNSTLEVIYLDNVDLERSTIENNKPRRFEICQLEKYGRDFFHCIKSSLLIATTPEVLMNSEKSIKSKYDCETKKIYNNALNYIRNERTF